jgi:hypothetical protein
MKEGKKEWRNARRKEWRKLGSKEGRKEYQNCGCVFTFIEFVIEEHEVVIAFLPA